MNEQLIEWPMGIFEVIGHGINGDYPRMVRGVLVRPPAAVGVVSVVAGWASVPWGQWCLSL